MQFIATSPHDPRAHALLTSHTAFCQEASPPGSCHFLDKDALAASNVQFWIVEQLVEGNDDHNGHDIGATTIGCAALQDHGYGLAELKSMHIVASQRGQGLAQTLLGFVEAQARLLGATSISLETGSSACKNDAFAPARALYASAGYRLCAPFGDYKIDPYSVFMTKPLGTNP